MARLSTVVHPRRAMERHRKGGAARLLIRKAGSPADTVSRKAAMERHRQGTAPSRAGTARLQHTKGMARLPADTVRREVTAHRRVARLHTARSKGTPPKATRSPER